MKYRRVAPIDARQWHKHGDHPAVVDVPHPHSAVYGPMFGWINGQLVRAGDWVVGPCANGGYLVISDGVFQIVYEPAE